MTVLRGSRCVLLLASAEHAEDLIRIRSTPEVRRWWRGDDIAADVHEALVDPDLEVFAILDGSTSGAVVGAIQWAANDDPEYAHAGVDVYLDPSIHGRGLGTDAVRTLCAYLFGERNFHRLVIDPAADNAAAIRCYEKAGFKRVGIMRAYELGIDGTFHDGLLMDSLATDNVTRS